jgi:2-dehydro-3-deoxyphosphogluconate aldolase/(4S)-4-hydroxy-2-oxoglutarate aldolase
MNTGPMNTGPADAAADVLRRLAANRIVPVLVLDDPAHAGPVADALKAGGLPVAEVTLRTPGALGALAVLASDPGLLTGAGTVISPDQVDAAVAAGAQFIVTPGTDPAILARCHALGVPVVPGVATASDIMRAIAAGISVVKLFPAEPLGGVRMLTALAAPFPGLRFIPTGGIDAGLLPRYLAHRAVLAVGGSWMVAPDLIRDGQWDEIRRRTAAAVTAARQEGGAAAPALQLAHRYPEVHG